MLSSYFTKTTQDCQQQTQTSRGGQRENTHKCDRQPSPPRQKSGFTPCQAADATLQPVPPIKCCTLAKPTTFTKVNTAPRDCCKSMRPRSWLLPSPHSRLGSYWVYNAVIKTLPSSQARQPSQEHSGSGQGLGHTRYSLAARPPSPLAPLAHRHLLQAERRLKKATTSWATLGLVKPLFAELTLTASRRTALLEPTDAETKPPSQPKASGAVVGSVGLVSLDEAPPAASTDPSSKAGLSIREVDHRGRGNLQ